MIKPEDALSWIPEGLRLPLLNEYASIVNNFMERRWASSELAGGRFCEVVYTILAGHASGSYASAPSKPPNFVAACRNLETNATSPRSFQILIPRLLPALYEIRNNRDVGHVGGEVSPDLMDSSAVVAFASWILAELIRVFHNVQTEEAQRLVDSLAERRIPLVWKSGDLRRVLDSRMALRDQVMILLSSGSGREKTGDLFCWTECGNWAYFNRLIKELHRARLVEHHATEGQVEILPPGNDYVSRLLQARG